MVSFINDHRARFGVEPICRVLQIAPSTYDDVGTRSTSARAVRDEELILEWKDIPICFVSGWYGNHLTANVDKFLILTERAESLTRLIVGHWEHHMFSTFAGAVDFGEDATMDIFGARRVEWFDQTLKGQDTGLLDAPRVEYFVMGGGDGETNPDGRLNHGGHWAASDSWPPANTEGVPFYLHADMTLQTAPPDDVESSTTYTFDPRDPVPTVGGNFMEYSRPDYPSRVTWMADGAAQDQRANDSKPFCRDSLPLATREDVLVFQTEPLTEDLEVSGELLARLWVSSSAPDTDFTVKLIEPGTIYEIELPFHSTSNVFKKGHRVRLDVSSSNFPRIDVNPNTGGPLGFPGPVHSADNSIHHDQSHPSQVVLPVVR